MEKKNVTIYYGLIIAVYSLGHVTMSAFSSLYLLDAGLSNATVGILLSIGSLISVLCQPYLGALIDRNAKVTTKNALLSISALVVMLGLLLIFIPNKSVPLTTLLYGASIFLLMLAQPFVNAIGMDAVNLGYPINFGMGRSFGSLGYAVGSYAFGMISVMAGPKSIPVAFSIAFLLASILIYIYPVNYDAFNESKKQYQSEEKENPLTFLIRYKKMIYLMIGLILIYFSHSLINTFALQILLPKGGTSGDMGTAAAIAAICELVTVLLFSFYMKIMKLETILRVSCIFFVLKIFFSFLAPTVPLFFAIQALQMFGWGFMTIGIIYYVNNLVSERDKAQGQAYAGMAYTIACVLATFLGGILIDRFGVDIMLLAGTGASIVGTVVLWFAI